MKKITAKRNQAGGSRPGAGRPKGEPTKAIGQRVPLRFHEQLSQLVQLELHKLLAQETPTIEEMEQALKANQVYCGSLEEAIKEHYKKLKNSFYHPMPECQPKNF